MPEVKARVELLAHTPDPLALVYAAFRQCYHAGDVADMWPQLLSGGISREKQALGQPAVVKDLSHGYAIF